LLLLLAGCPCFLSRRLQCSCSLRLVMVVVMLLPAAAPAPGHHTRKRCQQIAVCAGRRSGAACQGWQGRSASLHAPHVDVLAHQRWQVCSHADAKIWYHTCQPHMP
jgi:hypothetical protein